MKPYINIYQKYYNFINSRKNLKLLLENTINKFDFSAFLNMRKNEFNFIETKDEKIDLIYELANSSYLNKSLIFSSCLCVYIDDFKCEISYGCNKTTYHNHYDTIVSTNINKIRNLKFKNILNEI